MSRFLTAGLLLGTLIPAGQAAVFAVKPGTAFSKPQAKPELLLPLPEDRVQVPPLKNAAGICQFKHLQICRSQESRAACNRLGPLRLNQPASSELTPSDSAAAII